MVEQLAEQVYRMRIPLPDSPLKNLNSYVVKTRERSLIIDTGFHLPECLAALREGIRTLGLDMGQTDVCITHLHADHAGLANEIAGPGSKIYMGAADVELLRYTLLHGEQYRRDVRENFLSRGYPLPVLEQSLSNNPAFRHPMRQESRLTMLSDQDVIRLGDISLTCVHTPGHTPGHMCLYLPDEKIMFLGDHVLFDITPNITTWPTLDDALGTYLESLDKIKLYEVEKPMSAHRENGASMRERVDQLKAHHMARLDEIYEIIRDHPGMDCYNAAARMQWSIRARNWEAFPPTQKFFAVGEAAAHLVYLERRGRIRSHRERGVFVYEAA